MKTLTLQDRCDLYAKTFPKFPPLRIESDGRIQGIWIMGNNYQTKSNLYGAYPHGYLKRITSLFPDCDLALHLFSGTMLYGDYIRFDLLNKPDVKGDAHNLSYYFCKAVFDIIYADPPYSVEDSQHYGTPMINRNKIIKECVTILKPKGFIVWLDQVLPMYRKSELRIVGVIGMVKSTNHRFRMITIFQKQ